MAAVAPIESAKKVTPSEQGMSENVVELIETPEQMLARVLLPGEEVKSSFECYFPTEFVPRWKIAMLLVLTLGFYFFYMLFKRIQQWCYKMKCCTPSVIQFTRGHMAITNKGRIICWSESVVQVKSKDPNQQAGCLAKMCCPASMTQAPLTYTLEMKTEIFSAQKIRQISQLYSSSAACCCCCVDYDCMVEISFETFKPSSDSFVTTRSKWDFFNMIQSVLNTGVAAVESTIGVSSIGNNVLYIVSAS